MSRSKRKPYFTWHGWSNKYSKSLANRRMRRKTKTAILKTKEPPTHIREVSDVWDFVTDGLATYAGNWEQAKDNYKYLRK